MATKKDHTWFWVFTGLIVAMLIVFIAQNHQSVEIKFLIIHIKGPGFLVFLVVFLLGFGAGWVWEHFRRERKENKSLRKKEETYQGH